MKRVSSDLSTIYVPVLLGYEAWVYFYSSGRLHAWYPGYNLHDIVGHTHPDAMYEWYDMIWTAWHPLELARGAVRRSSLLENCQVKWKWMHRIDIVIHLKYLNITRVSYCVEECFKPATVAFYQKFCADPPYHDVSDWRGDGGNSNFTATHHHIKRSNGHAETCQGRKQSQEERFRVGAITNTRPMVWYNCYL